MSLPPSNPTGDGRRTFLKSMGLATASLGLGSAARGEQKAAAPIQGFDYTKGADAEASQGWKRTTDRKLRVGLVGHGVCKFAASFSFQDHPNVEVVAVSDLFPDRCKELSRVARCGKTYPSVEEMVKDPKIEAVFLCTDAPHHAAHSILALKHGKHVGVAVPAVFGENALEDAAALLATVKSTGLKYMMFETSCFQKDERSDLHAMRTLYGAGAFGRLVSVEGEYYHNHYGPMEDSHLGWRIGLPPQWYPTHSNAYSISVNDEPFTEVSCMGMPSLLEQFKPSNNHYRNPYATEVALFRMRGGGMARMAVSWDTPGFDGVIGRVCGEKGSYLGKYSGLEKPTVDLRRPPIPPGTYTKHHGGSHPFLTDDFVMAVLHDRKPLVDVTSSLNLSVSGFVAHQSAMKDGELLKIPQYAL